MHTTMLGLVCLLSVDARDPHSDSYAYTASFPTEPLPSSWICVSLNLAYLSKISRIDRIPFLKSFSLPERDSAQWFTGHAACCGECIHRTVSQCGKVFEALLVSC